MRGFLHFTRRAIKMNGLRRVALVYCVKVPLALVPVTLAVLGEKAEQWLLRIDRAIPGLRLD